MINFDSVIHAHDDLWYDQECEVVRAEVERLAPSAWEAFERQCLLLPARTQERMAYVLGDVDTVGSARLLLQLCRGPAGDTALTAREAIRSMTPDIVKQAALTLSPAFTGHTIEEILGAMQWTTVPPGEAASFDSKSRLINP